jgi:hypothetical protein
MGLGTPSQLVSGSAPATGLEEESEEGEEEAIYDMLSCLDDLHESEKIRATQSCWRNWQAWV